ncbi:cysteine hydrolase [Salinibacterium sp. NSLL150]|uniref:cysteine hydrolase family protein n=1 Tax=unclassified Salinibacterium TaxID=2632331 RepID=UPI0018CE6E8D|nr:MULTISPECIES: cysteine hydrolase family protein [unclassified Salinibacterium]MBH0098355.1 cysteine hydrolase [Salinibacterium sp. NSLL35]MBH0101110.1 cysteine hydrolase [Salinibacterium sp. NSLL150]MBH0103869.1 cysteine hydrolase [Salinibacterium sp. NSLL16]MBH0106630.1 cysteine hydrolase [Salinibacterium sp. NSLL17]
MASALIVVDVQQGFDDAAYWGPRNNPDCESNIGVLIGHWRREGWPIVYVRHDSHDDTSPLHPSSPGNAFKELLSGTPDLLVTKSVNSSFHGSPNLDEWLKASVIDSIVVCGITTNHCCETTARVGGNLGYDVTFVVDATHTFDREGPFGEEITADELSRITGVNLHDEFAQVVLTRDLVGGNAGFSGVVL